MQSLDSHTLDELQILSRNNKEGSIFQFFDFTKTQGGQDFLKRIIATPLSSLPEILSFQSFLKTISQNTESWQLGVSRAYIAAAENYYGSNISHTMSQDVFMHWMDTFLYSRRHPAEFYLVQSGLTATLKLIRGMRDLVLRIKKLSVPAYVAPEFDFLEQFILSESITAFLKVKDDRLSLSSIFYRDYYFRVTHKTSFRRLLDICYAFDAYISIAFTQQTYTLSFPEFVEGKTVFQVEKIWHPLIKNPTTNNFVIQQKTHLCLLTGANTSGKTTFLKTCGVVVYLAHLGWPVPAGSMHISYFDNLFTSIHLSDNLDLGYSHFYNEIMRIKNVAEALSRGEKCFVIIDELFRGTNQEDAFFCSKTVLDGFSQNLNSVFLVSTHLYELLENYKNADRICFRCFKTKITGNDFENTFQIGEGIASEKIGQLLLHKVGIPALLEGKS